MLFYAVSVLLMLSLIYSCESEPEVTSCKPLVEDVPEYETDMWGNVTFRGCKKVAKKWIYTDDNKECPHLNGVHFRIIKGSPLLRILKTDKCDYCGFSWNLHD